VPQLISDRGVSQYFDVCGTVVNYQFASFLLEPTTSAANLINDRLTGVEEEMILEVGLLAEASRADLTLEGPRSVVDVHVRAQIAGRWE
jgi:hypothetical protein